MPSQDPRPSFLIPEVARLTRNSREHIQRLVSSGEIPSYKVGHSRRISADTVDALMGKTPTDDDELDAYVRKLVDAAPRLTERQRKRLAIIIGGAK